MEKRKKFDRGERGMDSTNITNESQGKFSVTLRKILTILSLVLVVLFFCPSFLVSCSGEEVKVSAMTAVQGVKDSGQTLVDPHPVMLICLLLPVVILAALWVKKLLENQAEIVIFIAAAADFVVWRMFKNSVQEFADEHYCDVETTKVYGANLVILAVIAILTLLAFLMKISMDQDLIQLFSGGGGQQQSNSVICPKCGAKNVADAKYCYGCGNPLEGVGQQQSNPGICPNCGTKNGAGARFCKGCGNPLDGGGTAASGNTDSVNLSNPLSNVDLSNIQEKLKALPKQTIGIACAVVVVVAAIIGIVSHSSKTINLNDYLTVEAQGEDGQGRVTAAIDWDAIEEKYGEEVSYTKSVQKEYGDLLSIVSPIDALQGYVEVVLSQDSYLSNGDTVTYSWYVDESVSEYFTCKLKYKDGSYQVSGLQAAANDWGSEAGYIEQYGVVPETMPEYDAAEENDFAEEENDVVESDEYVTSILAWDIGPEFIYELCPMAEDIIFSNLGDIMNVGDLEYAGYIFCGTKPDVPYESIHNILYVIYKANVSSTEGEFEATDVYFPVEFLNLTMSYDYETNETIAGLTNFEGSDYTTVGYTDPVKLYQELAESNKGNYNVECGDGFEMYAE